VDEVLGCLRRGLAEQVELDVAVLGGNRGLGHVGSFSNGIYWVGVDGAVVGASDGGAVAAGDEVGAVEAPGGPSVTVTEIMATGSRALLPLADPLLGIAAIASTTSMPEVTSPMIAYGYCELTSDVFASSARTMKNCEPWLLACGVRAIATVPRRYVPFSGSSWIV